MAGTQVRLTSDQRPVLLDICRERDDTFPFDLVLSLVGGGNLDLQAPGVLAFTVNSLEEPPDNSTEIFTNTPVVVEVVAGPIQTVRVTVLAADVATPVEAFYDLQFVNGLSKRTLVKGQWNISQDIGKS